MAPYRKPLPVIDALTRPYWEHARRHALAVQHCPGCGHHWFPPGPVCPQCLHERPEWRVVSGRATLVSWCEFHRAYWPAFADELPYNVAIVQLEEGPRIVGNLVGTLPPLRRGLALHAVFDDVTPEISLVRFAPD